MPGITGNLNPSYMWHLHEKPDIRYGLRIKPLCILPNARTTKHAMDFTQMKHFCGTIITMR